MRPPVDRGRSREVEASRRLFARLVADAGWSIERLSFRVRDTFRGVSWVGKDVLEIGCGRGDFSLFMALNGARHVVAIEPVSAGSSMSAAEVLQRRLEVLAPDNLEFLPIRVEELGFDRTFDLVFGIQVVEHLYETKELVRRGTVAYDRYREAFANIHRLIRPGGHLVLTDVSRRSLWTGLRRVFGRRLRSPLAPTVYWEIHQYPETWFDIAREAGFDTVRLHWRVPHQLRRMPWLGDNAFVQYFTLASYILTAGKAEATNGQRPVGSRRPDIPEGSQSP